MTRIILVRHGRSMANVADIFAGITETPLTPHGLLQAQAVANYLFEHEKIDKVYASPLSRAMDTVRPTAERFGLSVIPDKGLIEVNGGRWEGLSFAALAEKYPEDFEPWISSTPVNASPTEGESTREVYARVVACIKRIAKENEGKTVLIGSHMTPVRALLVEALFGTVEAYTRKVAVPNASLHILRYENGALTPEKISITEHLGEDLL